MDRNLLGAGLFVIVSNAGHFHFVLKSGRSIEGVQAGSIDRVEVLALPPSVI